MTRPARRRGLSDRQVAALRKKAKRYIVPDPELRGHYVRVHAAGRQRLLRRRTRSLPQADMGHARQRRRGDGRGGPRQGARRDQAHQGRPASVRGTADEAGQLRGGRRQLAQAARRGQGPAHAR